jgi:hypothetical protein
MNATDDVFPFDLSRAELYWLAGALGMAALPLPDPTPAGRSPAELQSLQRSGHASLLTRGLIRPSPGFAWQVERLPAALLQWIASAPSLLRLERISRDGAVRCLHLFTAGEQGLSLEMDGDTARFVIFQSHRLLQESALRWLALPGGRKPSVSHALPQPLIFLPAAWKDPSLAARILNERGLDAQAAQSALAWAASLEWVAAVSKVKLEGTQNTLLRQYALCSDGKSLWGGEDEKQHVRFAPIVSKAVHTALSAML